ncbi:acyltransferase [Enterococcus cecorum]|uniref:acyltransferase n=1 Tax=Enterococcus cecorum TaxID=44008 RepID=UPI00148D984D|nr:acyltransferase [Enterococcus cecorum]CAI3259954.1 acyltransferase [Enterococcus cecorum]CAI3261280.1 acyltransferase [Enterococcus cecorum]CAI3261300.1 acyltransferase [Enterococcus cecorum]CAI3261813.1 acyltransferase [Enterococcus cecorum]CAI3283100.1 acyltransferase [Enterococcus cecorum]
MIWNRWIRILTKPYFALYQRIWPVKYAKKIGVNVGENCHFYGKIEWGTEPWLITIGNNVHITNNCSFINHDGGTLIFRDQIPDLEITKPITVGDNVYIGTDTLILMGVNIGCNVVIGARSLVTKDIPEGSVAVGHPAKVIKSTEEYLEKLKKESLHLGHLKGKEKDIALRDYYHYKK